MIGVVVVSPDAHYLLLLACSQRKRTDAALLPALERYDGGNYRLLRKAQRENRFPMNLDVLILSAKYGLITSSTSIPDYNQRMNHDQAIALKAQIMQKLQEVATQKRYNEIYVELGQEYLAAIDDLDQVFCQTTIIYAHGRIGERLAKLKQWLTQLQSKEACSSFSH